MNSLLMRSVMCSQGLLARNSLRLPLSVYTSQHMARLVQHVPATTQLQRLHTSPLKQSAELGKPGLMLASTHWKIERILDIGLLALLPGSILFYNPICNHLLAVAITLHVYWGIHAVLEDYVAYVIGPKGGKQVQKAAQALWKVVAALCFAGFCTFNFNGVGIVPAVKQIWSL